MREFFQGWRRKAGYATLVIAIAFTAGWIRSPRIHDDWSWQLGSTAHAVMSHRGTIYWIRAFGLPRKNAGPYWNMYAIEEVEAGPDTWARAIEVEWRWDFLGFHAGAMIVSFILPYWSIVIPLTLLSAYLILWKPRPKPKGEPDA